MSTQTHVWVGECPLYLSFSSLHSNVNLLAVLLKESNLFTLHGNQPVTVDIEAGLLHTVGPHLGKVICVGYYFMVHSNCVEWERGGAFVVGTDGIHSSIIPGAHRSRKKNRPHCYLGWILLWTSKSVSTQTYDSPEEASFSFPD